MLGSNPPVQDGMFTASHSLFLGIPQLQRPLIWFRELLQRLGLFKAWLTLLGVDTYLQSRERGRRAYSPNATDHDTNSLTLPKNRSTGNLLQHGARSSDKEKGRIRFSFDAGVLEHDAISR